MKKIKVLITGSAGFIMSNYVRRLIYLNNNYPNDYNYIVSSLDCVKSKSNTLNGFYNHKEHNFYPADITDTNILNFIFRLERPDVVIHGAALTNQDENINEYISSNVIGTENILRSCEDFNVKKLVYLTNLHIDDKTNHGITKSMSDLLVAREMKKSNFIINEMALPLIYGPRQSKSEIIPNIIDSILANEEIIIEDDEELDMLHVFDVCASLNLILQQSVKTESFNVNTNAKIRPSQLLNSIKYIINGSDFDISENILVNSKMINFGWQINKDLKNSLIDTVNWYLNNKWFIGR